MLAHRSKDAWIWVAVAAITLASLARAQSGIENARAYAAPVIKFFSGKALAESDVAAASARMGATREYSAFNLLINLLPVFFVGLVSGFSLKSAAFHRSHGSAISAPTLSALFQRPPPASLA